MEPRQVMARMIRVEGVTDLARFISRFEKKLPSTSQWYRLRQLAATGDAKKVHAFLEDRRKRKKTRAHWIFDTGHGIPFYRWMEQVFLDPVQDAGDIRELQKVCDFRVAVNLSYRRQAPDLSEIKRLVVKKALCGFIDQLLLLLDNFTWKVVRQGGISKMEVEKHA